MKLNSFAWHKDEKVWVKILGMRDMTAEFNPNGRFFTYRHFGNEDERLVASTAVLKSMEDFAGLRVDKRVIDTKNFRWSINQTTVPVLPQDMPVYEPLEVGDHVTLDEHNGYAARVVDIYTNDRGVLQHKLKYYIMDDYRQRSQEYRNKYRIPHNNTTTQIREVLTKLSTPAPRVQLNPETVQAFKAKVKQNLRLNVYKLSIRRASLAPKDERLVLKDRGAVIARFIAESRIQKTEYLSNNTSAILAQLGAIAPYKAREIVERATEYCRRVEDYIRVCPNCEAIEGTYTFSYSESSDTEFCRSCEDNFRWSEVMDDYIHTDNSVSLFDTAQGYHDGDPSDVATRYWINDSDSYSMYNGHGVANDCLEELRDSDETDGTGLREYHRTERNWREVWVNKNYLPLGVELEVYANPRKPAVMAVKKALPGQVYLERDGSLNGSYGFEVITQPFGKKEWETVGNTLLKTLKGKGAIAWNTPAGKGYGIHININRAYLSSLQEARMFMFLAAAENVNFNRAIAQRCNMYNESSGIGMGKTPIHRQKVTYMGGLDQIYVGEDSNGDSKYRKVLMGKGKYCPAYFHDGRMEIRMFQSTLNTVSFYKNLEFVWALVEWTSVKAATGTSWQYKDFLKWLVKRPHAEQDFPNLMAYLRRGTYTMRDGGSNDAPHEIRSEWQDLIPKPVRSSVAGEAVEAVNSETSLDDVVVVVPKYARSVPKGVETLAMAA